MSTYSEKEIIIGCQQDNRLFQELLYEQYFSKLLKICVRYAKCFEDAEQLMNDSFLKIFSHINDFKQNGSFEGWMKKITVNACLDYLKSKQFKEQLKIDNKEELENVTFTNIDANVFEQMNFKDLIAIIYSLPSVSKAVFNLYVFEGYLHKEIAILLGISEGTSSWHLHHARNLLQKKIKENNLEKPLYEHKRV